MADERSPPSPDSSAHRHQPISLVRFDSANLDPDWRYEAWGENIGALFDVTPHAGSPAQSEQRAIIAAANLNGNALGLAQAPSQIVSRSLHRLA